MRIAVTAHVRHPISPPFMGGMETHAWHLVRGLAERGHEVTLLASGDSAPGLPDGVRLLPVLEAHYDRVFPWHDFHGTETLNAHLDGAFARVCEILREGRFDVIHNNALHRDPVRLSRSARLPMVTSLHVPPFAGLARAVTEASVPWCRFTVTSARQRERWWPDGVPAEAGVVFNGIDPALWPFAPGGDGSAVWAGRITPTKGTHLAIEAARLAGVPLTIFGVIEHEDYFETAVRPHLGGAIRYGGHVSGAQLAGAYAAASALLFTPCWDEPFGLAAVEAMATGLPVAATDMGAVREVVGRAGCVARPDDPDDLARALRAALSIPPALARDRVLRTFTLEHMLDGYEAQYAAAIHGADVRSVSTAGPVPAKATGKAAARA